MAKTIWQRNGVCPVHKPHTVYKVAGSQGVLYIGRTKRKLETRLSEHERKNAPWSGMVKTIDTICVGTKEEAEKVEKESIAKHCPIFNKQNVPDRCKINPPN